MLIVGPTTREAQMPRGLKDHVLKTDYMRLQTRERGTLQVRDLRIVGLSRHTGLAGTEIGCFPRD